MPTFFFEGKEVVAEDGETVLSALLRHGIAINNKCQAGACQTCLLSTNIPLSGAATAGIDDALVAAGAFLSCQAKPVQDMNVGLLDESAIPVYPAVLKSKEVLSRDVLLAKLSAPGWPKCPGKFLRITHRESGIERAYSVATPAWEDSSEIHLHIRLIEGGAMSEVLKASKAGENFDIRGPFGKCSYQPEQSTMPLLLIGSGTGLAPLYGIITDAIHQGHRAPILLYHGAGDPGRLYFEDELRAMGDRLQYTACVDQDPREGMYLGSPVEAALQQLGALDGYRVYLCGHPDLVKTAQRKCFMAGANMRDISADPFLPT